jgi:ferredoxin--NADP+ reductase
VLRFLISPSEILGERRVENVRLVRNRIVALDDGQLAVSPAGTTETIEAGLVLRSIGYHGTALPGLPFDELRGTLPNDGARVIDPASGLPILGVYAAGWIKRGPTGVIGTNKKCAHETVAALLYDHAAGRLPEPSMDPATMRAMPSARNVRVVDYRGWTAIDEFECRRGERSGRPRIKIVRREQLLQRAASGDIAHQVV